MKKVALKNFFRRPNGDCNLYETDLGWNQSEYDEAMASTSEGVLRYNLDIGYDLYLFDTKTMRWYFISTCSGPGITLVRLKPKKAWDGKFLDENIEPFHMNMKSENVEFLFHGDTIDEFVKGAVIDGTPIAEVMNRSWIDFS